MNGAYPEWNRHRMTLPRVLFRFFSGRPLDGVRRTDAIFMRPGKRSMDPSGYASKWSLLAGYQRLVFRLLGLYVLGVAGWTLVAPVTWVQVLLFHALWVGVLGSVPFAIVWVRAFGLTVRVPDIRVRRTQHGVRVRMEGWTSWTIQGRRSWVRTYVRPVAAAADHVLGTSHHKREAPKWVYVPRDFRNADGGSVVLQLPAHFHGADEGTKRRLVSAVGSRLGLRDPSVSWELEGDRPRVLISSPPVPPSFVSFADVEDRLGSLSEYSFLLGLAARSQVLTADLTGDSPHIAVSAGSGAGKSEMLKVLIMQALRRGWGVIILDWKEVSQEWADGLPGVVYVRDIAAIHDMCIRLGEEVDIRKALYRQDKTMPGKAKVMVVAEEMNITADLLMAYWQDLRATAEPEERRTMPVKSPAMRGLQAVNFGGRQFQMFMVFVAQRFSARVTNGNADLRESFQTRLLARGSGQTQKMLAPQIKPFPKMGVTPGLWCAVIGQEAVVYQAPLITDDEARAFSLGGQDNPTSPLAGAWRPSVPSQRIVDGELGESLGDGPALPSQRSGSELTTVDARKLSEMVDGLAHLGVSLDILRHASKDPNSGFPGAYGGSPNRGYTYDYQAVQEWARKRHASRAANGEVKR